MTASVLIVKRQVWQETMQPRKGRKSFGDRVAFIFIYLQTVASVRLARAMFRRPRNKAAHSNLSCSIKYARYTSEPYCSTGVRCFQQRKRRHPTLSRHHRRRHRKPRAEVFHRVSARDWHDVAQSGPSCFLPYAICDLPMVLHGFSTNIFGVSCGALFSGTEYHPLAHSHT